MSFFRTPIDEKIQKELFKRVDSINFNQKTEGALDPVKQNIEHQFIKSCWARAAVVLSDGKPVFLNSNLANVNKKGKLEPLNIKDGAPTRGRPGITSINANFKEYFIKQATINFFVPDPNDFDDFKNDFLKFGRYMMVEFGWSLPYTTELPTLNADSVLQISKDIQARVLKSDGNYNAIVGVVTNYTFNLTKEGAYEGTIELSSMGRNILGQTSSGDGKVENLVGYVNEKLAQENPNANTTNDQIFRNLRKTFVTFNAAMKSLPDIVKNYATNDGKAEATSQFGTQSTYDTTYNVWSEKKGVYYVKGTDIIRHYDNTKSNEIILVSWGWFEDFILNSFFSFVSESENDNEPFRTEFFSADMKKRNIQNPSDEVTIEFGPDSGIGTTAQEREQGFSIYEQIKCRNHPELFSLGFDSIILPGQTKTFSTLPEFLVTKDKNLFKPNESNFTPPAFNGYFIDLGPESKDLQQLIEKTNTELNQFDPSNEYKTGIIRNMYFNIDYLLGTFGDFSQNIEQLISKFWQKVSDDYGGFWRFAVTENPNVDGRMMITDLNIGSFDDTNVEQKLSTPDKPNQIFPFKVYSKNSIVSDISLESSNDSEMATLAVFGSNTDLNETSADEGKGYQALAMRALSMIDNTYHNNEGENQTQEKQKGLKKYDAILNNISNPVFGNFKSNKKTFEGTSAEYFPDGRIKSRKRSGGINFTKTPEVIQTTETIEKTLTDISLFNVNETTIRGNFYWPDKQNYEQIQIYSGARKTMLDEFKRTMLYLINKAPGEDSNYSVVLPVVPLQISLTLQGIGGIKIGDLFKVDYLPKRYRDFCHFMVTNVEHNIDTTGWTTKLDSRMIVDIPKLLDSDDTVQRQRLQIIEIKKNLDDEINEEIKKLETLNKSLRNDQIKREYERYYESLASGAKLYNKKRPSIFKRWDANLPTYEEALAEYNEGDN